jgi:hypothetical protein
MCRTTRESKLDAIALGALLDALDSQSGADPAAKDRTTPRQAFRKTVRIEIPQPKGSAILYALTRNISEKGAGLLTGSFVYPGSAVRLHLEKTASVPLILGGTVRYCRYLTGSGYLHEIGVAFDAPLDLAVLNRVAVPQDKPAPDRTFATKNL